MATARYHSIGDKQRNGESRSKRSQALGLQGDQWAYIAGIVAILLGAVIVFFFFPRKESEEALLAEYNAQDRARYSSDQATTLQPPPGSA